MMLRSLGVLALGLSIALTMSACSIPDIIAHGIKSYDKGQAGGDAPPAQHTQSGTGNSFESLPTIPAEEPPVTHGATGTSGRQGVMVEEL